MKTLKMTTSGRLTKDSQALLEVAMMNGRAIECSNELLEQVLKYCVPAMSKVDDLNQYVQNVMYVVKRQYNHSDKDREVVAICFNRIYGMPCITFVLNDFEYPEPCTYRDLGTGAYVFCYVLNLESDWCSEFGDCYFEDFKRMG